MRNPDKIFNTVLIFVESLPYIQYTSKKEIQDPKHPNPTTLIPITDPPLNAMFKADSKFDVLH